MAGERVGEVVGRSWLGMDGGLVGVAPGAAIRGVVWTRQDGGSTSRRTATENSWVRGDERGGDGDSICRRRCRVARGRGQRLERRCGSGGGENSGSTGVGDGGDSDSDDVGVDDEGDSDGGSRGGG